MRTSLLIVATALLLGSGCTRSSAPQPMSTAPPVNPTIVLETTLGAVTVELLPSDAPVTVEHILAFVRSGFYDGTQFHRVIPDFMIQGGDPLTREQPDAYAMHGTGGPVVDGKRVSFADEINEHRVVRGALAMANSGPNTNGSQFFIVTIEAAPWLDGRHTVFGRVTSGMDVVDRVSMVPRDRNDHPIEPVVLTRVRVAE